MDRNIAIDTDEVVAAGDENVKTDYLTYEEYLEQDVMEQAWQLTHDMGDEPDDLPF